MKRLITAAVTTGLLGLGAVATASPASAASCSVYPVKTSASGPAWRASCPSTIGYKYFRLRVTCLRVVNTNAYQSYGAWARSGSGTSTATCSSGYTVTQFQRSFSN